MNLQHNYFILVIYKIPKREKHTCQVIIVQNKHHTQPSKILEKVAYTARYEHLSLLTERLYPMD